ncbi:hypothetical protein [Nocardioides taihuensis]|uniref:Uncharacterized protein n=1 Tax=Nocardioides taihuensis TaxID=1835606 RepID=A0ABW0BQA9_9ACTN
MATPATADHLDSGAVMSDVVVGDGHVCSLSTGGAVWCWGDNTFGQLGTGSDVENEWRPGLVPGLSGVTALAAGAHHTCAVFGVDGEVACWGRNDSGQLGNGSTKQSSLPVVAEGVTGATMVAAGRAHTCVVTGAEPDQEVWCWGANGFGQLGLGSVADANLSYGNFSAGLLLGHDSVASDEAGRVFTSTQNARVFAFDEDGNTEQSWRVGSGAAPGGAVAPTGDGGAWAADPRGGSPLLYRLLSDGGVAGPANVTDPAMGCTGDLCRLVGLAPTPDGGVVAGVVRDSGPPVSWLRRYDATGAPLGGLVKVPNTTGPITDLAASRNETGTATSIFALEGERVVRFTTSLTYVSEFSLRQVGEDCAIRDDYTATSQDVPDDPTKADWTFTRRLSDFQHSRFGTGDDGYLSVLLQYDLITRTLTQRLAKDPAPEIPEDHGQYIDAPGSPATQPLCLATADAFGAGAGTLTEVPTSAAVGTDLHASIDVTSLPDGGFAVSDDDEGTNGPRLSRLVRITAGGGDVAGWGRVSFRSIPARSVPAWIWRDGLNGNSLATDEITSLAAGRHHTCVGVRQDTGAQVSTAFGCWGADGAGQVSAGAEAFSSLSLGRPPAVTGSQTSFPVTSQRYAAHPEYAGPVFAGGNQTCQLRPAQLICRGDNDAGQLGAADPAGGFVLSTVSGSDLGIGGRHTCVVVPASPSGLTCWGANESFQLGSTNPVGSPVALPGATAVSAGRETTCAIKDGDVWCWGSREDGQIGDPDPLPVPNPVAIGYFPGVDAVVAGPATLDDPATVTFGLPADAVTGSNVVLRSASSGLPVSTTLICRDGDGSVVDCAAGVALAEVRPVAGWVPGGSYELEVNPAGVEPATVSGVPVTADIGEFRAATSVDAVTPSANSAWGVVRARKALDGTYLRERTAGAALNFDFRGRHLRLITPSGPKFGKASVQVDDRKPLVINLYAPAPHPGLVHAILRVGRGAHTATFTALGRASRQARNTFVGLDGLETRSGLVGSPVAQQTWSSAVDDASGALLRSRARGSTWQLAFEGTGVSWYGPSGPGEGEAKVYVDGVLREVVTGYADVAGTVVHTFDGLTDGPHTLLVKVKSKGPGPLDLVSIDGAEIH